MENTQYESWNQPHAPRDDNKKLAAGLLAILLGPFGIHKFILGYTTEGLLYLLISLLSCGVVSTLLGIIEGIIYLSKGDEEFYRTYQLNKKAWF